AAILKLNLDNMIPDGAGKGNLVIEGNGQFQSNNVNETINGLSSASSTAVVTKSGSNTRTLTVGAGDATASYAGSVSWTGGSSGIVKTGLGTQTFGGTTTLAGAFSVNAGTLLLNGTATAASATTAAGATIGGTGTATLTGAFTVNGMLSPGTSPGVFS